MLYHKMSISLLLAFVLTSCATNSVDKKTEPKQLTRVEIEAMNTKAIDRVSKRLEELSVAAKASGPDKVRFLASDMYLKASAALMEGDYQAANLIFEHLITLEPNDDFIKQKYAVSLIRTGDIEDSEKILAEVFNNTKKKDVKIGLVLAGVYSSLGKVKKSRSIYKRLISLHPKQEEACIFLAKSYALEKKTSRALNLLKKCAKKNPTKGIYGYYMGKIFVDKKQYVPAKKYFQQALRAQRDFSQAVMALGLIQEELGHFQKAKRTYKNYLKKNPNDTLILSRLVQLLFTIESFTEVIEYAERLSDYEPDNLNLKVKLAIIYKDVKSYRKAVRIFKDLLVFAPDNDQILYYLGATFQETKDYQDAIEYFGKINVDSGLYHDSSFQIAQMLSYMAKGEYLEDKGQGPIHKEFVKFIDGKIKEINAFKVDFSVVKATYFENLEDNNEAIETLEYVKEDKAFNNEHRFYLAALFEKESKYDKATKLIEEILETDPKNAHAWNFLGYSMLERGQKLDTALDYIKKAIKLKPNDGYIRDSLGWYYFKTGKYKMALVELRKAIAQVPNDVSINKHLAIVYTKMNNFSKAKEFIRKALAFSQSESDKKELNEVLKSLEKNRIPASFEISE